MKRYSHLFLLSLSVALASLTSCSRSSTTTTETTTTRPVASSEPSEVASTTTTERTVTTEDNDGCGGILSCTVDVVGEIIALPFRAVGALFRVIF